MKDDRKRIRVTIPKEDMAILAWLKAQENISMSIRQLIKFDCMEGITDVMCRPLPGMAAIPVQEVTETGMARAQAAPAAEYETPKAVQEAAPGMGNPVPVYGTQAMPVQMPQAGYGPGYEAGSGVRNAPQGGGGGMTGQQTAETGSKAATGRSPAEILNNLNF